MVVVSLDMFLNSIQDNFVKYRNDKFCVVRGKKNSGKTTAAIFKALYLKRNYCFDLNDKILFLSSEKKIGQVVDIFNYINRSDLYKSIIPSDDIEVHILTIDQLNYLTIGTSYTHIIIDNIEKFIKSDDIYKIFDMFKNLSYSKVYFIQDSNESIDGVNEIVEYLRRITKSREVLYKFRYVIEEDDQDEFTQIDISPEVKYLNYIYKDYVDFNTKEVFGYYTNSKSIYKDMGTFLYDLSNESRDIFLIDRYLNIKDTIKILKDWIPYKEGLYFVEIDDEGMSKHDLFIGDMVLIDSDCEINEGDVVVVLKENHLYARMYTKIENDVKFVANYTIFNDIYLTDCVKIVGKVLAYIRKYNNF